MYKVKMEILIKLGEKNHKSKKIESDVLKIYLLKKKSGFRALKKMSVILTALCRDLRLAVPSPAKGVRRCVCAVVEMQNTST